MSDPPRSPAIDRTAWILAAVAVLIPIVILLFVDRSQWCLVPDTPSYLRPGVAFWEGRGYTMEYFGRTQPEMHRTPIYPVLLGASQVFAKSWIPLLLLQCLARGAIVLAVASCVGVSDRIRSAVVALVALDPLAAVTATQLQTETLSSLMLALAAVGYLRGSMRATLIASFLLGLSVPVRPVNIVLLPLGAIAVVAQFRAHPRVLVVALTLIVLSPGLWVVRNAAYSGSPVLSLTGSNSLYHYRAAGIVAEVEGRPLAAIQAAFRASEESEIIADRLTPWEAAERRTAKARTIIAEHPGIYVRQWLKGLATALIGPGRETWNALAKSIGAPSLGQIFTALAMLHLAASYLFFAGRLVGRRPTWPSTILVAAFLLPIMAAAGPEAYSRFRVPLMALLLLGALPPRLSPRGDSLR